jgi:tetratricopeptide (TPR) repeat protein
MSRARSLVLAASALALCVGTARAADDAGTRSVFAAGAGTRAIALGSAFGALADDASALLWNPGGLPDVTRIELQLSHASLNDLGFGETFAAVTVPDWRWGAAALALRSYGVDEIDGRDDRNLPTGTFADRETELALGYGRPLGAVATVGVAARVRRQSLAGRSGSGLGVDLGFKLRPAEMFGVDQGWLRDLQVGLALQNVVEPAIRLDRESVADPLTGRLGFAFARPGMFGALGGLLAVVDLELAKGTSLRPHAGLELRPHPMLALRTGVDQGALTAGAGFRFGDGSFDYAYVDLPTGPSQRAGLTWRFGRSVGDARAAAARAEEQRLQERLVVLERERSADRVASLLAGAQAARDAQRYDEALEALTTLLVIDSTHAGARELRAQTQRERAQSLEAAGNWSEAAVAWARRLADAPGDTAAIDGLARSRAASDRLTARSADVRRALDQALDAFTADDLPTARVRLTAVLDQHPGDEEAQSMLRRVDAAIARRTSSWLQQAHALARAGSFAEARTLIDRARALDPRAPGLAAATGAVLRAEQAAEAARTPRPTSRPAAAPAAPPALTAEQLRDLPRLYRQGLDALAAGRSDDALRLLEQVVAISPGYQQAAVILERECLTRGLEHFSAGRLEQAIAMWERALRVDPHDPKTLGYLARAHEQMARARAISESSP